MTTCIECGCTDDNACPEGCYWLMKRADDELGICSSCEDGFEGLTNEECMAILEDYEAEQQANAIAEAADREDAGELILPGDPEYYNTLRGSR